MPTNQRASFRAARTTAAAGRLHHTAAPTMPPTMTTPPAAETLAMSAVFFAAEVGWAVHDQEQSPDASQVLAFAAAATQRDVCLS